MYNLLIKFRTLIVCILIVGVGLAVHAAEDKGVTPPIPSSHIPIILYHHIQDLPENISAAKRRWSLAPRKFEEQMEWIANNGFHPITMSQFIAHYQHGEVLPSKPIVITFDDGWEDQFTAALPVLKKFNFTATFFIITDMVGHSAYLNWDQIKEMSQAGMDIQSHTLTHQRLSILSNEKARHEITDSKRILEDQLKKPVTILAYPYGSYDEDVIAVTKEAGYQAAATVSGLNGGYLLRADRSFTINRYALAWSDDLAGIARWKHFDSYGK